MKKKILALLMLGIMTLSLAGCSGSKEETPAAPAAESGTEAEAGDAEEAEPAEGEKLTVGCVWFNLTTEFQAKVRLKIMDEFAANYPNVEVVEIDGNSDANTQITAVENLISQNVDCIILSPFDAEQLVPAVQEAKDAGIPLIEITVATKAGDDVKTSYIGGDDAQAGSVCMEYLAECADYKGGVIVLQGPAGQNSQIQRYAGAESVIDQYEDMEIVADQFCDWDRAAAMEAVENYIQAGLEFTCIYCENDEMALGAAAAIAGTELEGKVFIGGVDGINDAINAIGENTLTCTSYYNADGIAKKATEAAVKAGSGETIESWYEVPFELVNADNISQYEGQ